MICLALIPAIGITMSQTGLCVNSRRMLGEGWSTAWRSAASAGGCTSLTASRETGEGLPEITELNVLAMMESTLNNVPQLLQEAVTEVFEWLRPPNNHFKTNTQFEVGNRVILEHTLEFWGRQYSVNHYRQAKLVALDNVFHMLDGKGSVKTTRGALSDAIHKCTVIDNIGETDYFKFKCYRNHNLHIEFKRLDLVEQLNVMAGGNRLKPEMEAA